MAIIWAAAPAQALVKIMETAVVITTVSIVFLKAKTAQAEEEKTGRINQNYSCCAAMGRVRAFLGNSEQQAEEEEEEGQKDRIPMNTTGSLAA